MTIDISLFTRVPKLSIKQMLRLAKTLIRDIPQPANAAIEAAAGQLEDHIKRVELALTQWMAAANAEVSPPRSSSTGRSMLCGRPCVRERQAEAAIQTFEQRSAAGRRAQRRDPQEHKRST